VLLSDTHAPRHLPQLTAVIVLLLRACVGFINSCIAVAMSLGDHGLVTSSDCVVPAAAALPARRLQVASCAQCRSAQQQVQRLQGELEAAQQHAQHLQRQMAALADSHVQELEQAKMDCEAEAAAAMLDAAAATARQRSCQQRQQQDVAVQVDLPQSVSVVDAAVQTASHHQQQQQQQLQPTLCVSLLRRQWCWG